MFVVYSDCISCIGYSSCSSFTSYSSCIRCSGCTTPSFNSGKKPTFEVELMCTYSGSLFSLCTGCCHSLMVCSRGQYRKTNKSTYMHTAKHTHTHTFFEKQFQETKHVPLQPAVGTHQVLKSKQMSISDFTGIIYVLIKSKETRMFTKVF